MIRAWSSTRLGVDGSMDIYDRFEKLEEIGKGNFGVVNLVRAKDDGELYVLKEVKLQGMKDQEVQGALQEVPCSVLWCC